MKRLLPLLLLLLIAGAGLLPASVWAQDKSSEAFVLIVRDDTASTFIDVTVEIDVLANDEDTNPGFTVVLDEIVTAPRHGTARIDRNNTIPIAEDDVIVYDPDPGFIGADSLVYQAKREPGGSTATATVRIFVNRAPTANDDRFTVGVDDPVILLVTENDSDPDGDTIDIADIVTGPKHGTVLILQGAPDALQYNPTDGYVGPDSLTYRISDGKNGFDTAIVRIEVTNLPEANDDTASVLPGTSVIIDVLANDSDPDDEDLTITDITDAPGNGSAAIVENGTRIRYAPNVGFVGTDTFEYEVTDEVGGTATATVTVRVNNAPVAVTDNVTTPISTSVLIDVVANDTDADDDDLTLQAIVTPPSHGTAVLVNTPAQIRYTPETGYFGTDTFTYRIVDEGGATAIGTVNITILADAFVQVVHNAAGAGSVDVYIDDERVANNLDFREATPYLTVSAGMVTVDLTEGTASNNDNPIFSETFDLGPNEAVGVIANGGDGATFEVGVRENARIEADESDDVEFYLVNGVPDAPANGFDLRLLDPFNSNLPFFSLANNLEFNEVSNYQRLEPGVYNIDVTGPDNQTLYEVFQFDLNALMGESLVMVVSGRIDDGSLRLLAFDADGDLIEPAIVTSTDPTTEVPETFALHGNFPNPFNPRTTLLFDLPATARVHVEVVDVLGRRVLVTPPQQREAGFGQTLGLEAAQLASGAYFYRLIAETATETLVQTGRLTLIK